MRKWTTEQLQQEALKYTTRIGFIRGNQGAYSVARKRGLLPSITGHMPKHQVRDYSGAKNPSFKWTKELIKEEASKYYFRSDFQKNNGSAYVAAIRTDILDEICSHMKKDCSESSLERMLFIIIKQEFPSAKKLRKRKIVVANKPYIKGFDIDIYVHELSRGIEFDGTYYHSFRRMRDCKRKMEWSDEDICNYHQIKDDYFKSKGIEILHIKEKDWIKNRQSCIDKCFKFLRS
jgi:hypothetical protein